MGMPQLVQRWRDAILALLRDASPDVHERYEDFARGATFAYSGVVAALILVVLLVTWPLDVVVGAGSPDRLARLSVWRLTTLPIPILTVLVFFRFVRTWKRFRLWMVAPPLHAAAFVSGWLGAQIGPLTEPWLFALIYLPAATVMMLTTLPRRIVLTLSTAVTALIGVLFSDPTLIDHTSFSLLTIYMFTQSAFSIGLGEFWRVLARELFSRSQAVKQQNRHLSELVHRRTQQSLQAIHDLDRAEETVRADIARDLHDDLGHLLVAYSLRLEALRRRDPNEIRLKEEITGLQDGLRAIEMTTRRTVSHLREVRGMEGRLSVAIGSRLAAFAAGDDGEIEVESVVAPDEIELPADQAIAVSRIVQEALTNVRKHSGAKRVVISALRGDSGVSINIRDDGAGFETGSTSSGNGLVGMRERASSVGGSLEIRSAPGRGTELIVELPLEAP